MIQRIQTLYLLGVLVVFGLMFFVPIAKELPRYQGNSLILITGTDKVVFFIQLLIPVFSIMTLYMKGVFKSQINFCTAGIFYSLFAFFLVRKYIHIFDFQPDAVSGYVEETKWGLYLLLIYPILFFLAARAIKKDEQRVRAADRLR
ncbi:MAG TPA: DUF4293 family protein [Bacteroidia bacterium]|jgi:hypothetical protein|nr:DUF4293 family protein [Bacteroidia bacterium]